MAKKLWIFSILGSLFLHIFFVWFLLFEKKEQIFIGGMSAAEVGEFASIAIVADLPQDILRQIFLEQMQQKKGEENAPKEENLDEKTALTTKNDENPNLNLYKAQKIAPKLTKKAAKITQKSEQKAEFNAKESSKTQDNSASVPLAGDSTKILSPAQGIHAKFAKSWQGQVMAHLNRHKKYPQKALIDKKEGTVKISVTIDFSGRVLEAKIRKSSGSQILDNETLSLFSRASPLPRPPEDILKGKNSLNFAIPIDYNIAKFYARKAR